MTRISNIVSGTLSSKPRTKIIDESILSFTGAGDVSPLIQEAWAQAYEEEDGSYKMWVKIRSSHAEASGPHTYSVGGASIDPSFSPSISVVSNGSGSSSGYISETGKIVVSFPASTATIVTTTVKLTSKPSWFDSYIESDDGISLATAQEAQAPAGDPNISLNVEDNLWQKKVVYSNVVADGSFMAFTNLTVGMTYKLHISLAGGVNDGEADNSIRVKVMHGGSPIDVLEGQSNSTQEVYLRSTVVFKASSSYLTLDAESASDASYIFAEALSNGLCSHVIIEECPYLSETSKF